MLFICKYMYLYIKFISNLVAFYIVGIFKKNSWKTHKLRKIEKLMKDACSKLMI